MKLKTPKKLEYVIPMLALGKCKNIAISKIKGTHPAIPRMLCTKAAKSLCVCVFLTNSSPEHYGVKIINNCSDSQMQKRKKKGGG